jgi:hypothetical protein
MSGFSFKKIQAIRYSLHFRAKILVAGKRSSFLPHRRTIYYAPKFLPFFIYIA